MTTLQEKLAIATDNYSNQVRQDFQQRHRKRAEEIIKHLSLEILKQLNVVLVAELQPNSGTFVFQLNERDYELVPLVKGRLEVRRGYFSKEISSDDELLQFLAKDSFKEELCDSEVSAFPSGESGYGGMTVVDWLTGQAIAAQYPPIEAVQVAKLTYALLYPKKEKQESRSYTFAEVMSWPLEEEKALAELDMF